MLFRGLLSEAKKGKTILFEDDMLCLWKIRMRLDELVGFRYGSNIRRTQYGSNLFDLRGRYDKVHVVGTRTRALRSIRITDI